MREFTYVKGKEIKSYQDIVDAVDGIIINDRFNQAYAMDQTVLLRRNEELSVHQLEHLNLQGYTVYVRQKQYRKNIFTRKIDYDLESLLTNFYYEYSCSEYSSDSLIDDTITKLKQIFHEYQASLDGPLCEGWQGPESCNNCEMLDCNCNPKHKED